MKKRKYQELASRLRRKALTSYCKYSVSALGFNRKGELIGTSRNRPRFNKYGGGIHAEMELMRKSGPGLKTILICRTNKNGDLLPIHPCMACSSKARELGIKILTLLEI